MLDDLLYTDGIIYTRREVQKVGISLALRLSRLFVSFFHVPTRVDKDK